jgi:aminoglycoside phosphotransferase (APT) family kinase protein
VTGRLPDSWAGLPALEVLLDAARLTGLFGQELGGALRTSSLRYKPGVSAVARLDVAPTGAVHWVAAFAPPAAGRAGKLDKAVARGRLRLGTDDAVLVRDVPGRPGHRLAVGRIGADLDLGGPLAQLGADLARDLGGPGQRHRLLRFNPRRRLVLTGHDDDGATVVTKLTARPAPVGADLLTRLAAAGIPVLAPTDPAGLPRGPHVLHYPWFGDGDLAGLGVPERAAPGPDVPGPDLPAPDLLGTAAEAGAALARLHLLGPEQVEASRVPAAVDPAARLGALAADLEALDAGLAERFARTAQAAAAALAAHGEGPARLLHGDFSADQVLVHRAAAAGAPRLLLADLDRLRAGAPADDLGCFLAVELLTAQEAAGAPPAVGTALAEALSDGYGRAATALGACPPARADVLAWAAFHVLARAAEPFRSTAPGWRETTAGRLELAERLLRAARRDAVPHAVPRTAPHSASHPVPRSLSPADAGAAPRTGPSEATGPVPVPDISRDISRDIAPETVPDADGRPLRVRRAWPAAEARILLELEDEQGRVRAGESVPRPRGGREVRVAPHAEDPRLPGLASAAAAGRLVVHRWGRRAVVAAPDRYVKLLARGKAERVAAVSVRLHDLGTAAGFAVPAVLASAGDRVEFSVLPGRSLHELGAAGDGPAWRAAWEVWARHWPVLATAVPGAGELPEHTAEDEARTLLGWAAHLESFPGLLRAAPGAVAARAEQIAGRLVALPADRRARAVLHRDLHDQQLLFDGARAGLLDFDTAAVGEPALDLANLAVHLDLRVAQGLLAPELRTAGRAAVDEVGRRLAVDPARLAVHAEATRLRLACVYAFRPRWRAVAQQLLDGRAS